MLDKYLYLICNPLDIKTLLLLLLWETPTTRDNKLLSQTFCGQIRKIRPHSHQKVKSPESTT